MDERKRAAAEALADAANYAATVGKLQAWHDFMEAMTSLDFERATAIHDENDFDTTLLEKSQKIFRKYDESMTAIENNTAAPA